MKKIISALCALYASVAFGATTVPVQLLNPTGSSAGQAIVSTGASSAPAWGGIGVNGIAAIAANTVLANGTGSSAAPTAFAMPNCSTSSSILQYTSGTGFTCSTTIWASPPAIGGTTPSTGKFTTLQATGAITPSTTAGIVGTTLADNANAGSVGEFISANVASGSAVALTSNTVANVTTITLTPGDWEVRGSVAFNPGGTTAITALGGWITTTSATNPGAPNGGALAFFNGLGGTAGQNGNAFPVGTIRLNVSVTTTVYLCAFSIFSTSTNAAYGFIGARRVR